MVSGPSSALALIAQSQQDLKHQHQVARAFALNTAAILLAADSDEVDALLADALPPNASGMRRLELLTSTLLTYIETGRFLETVE